MTTASELADELEKLAKSATAGPWEEENGGGRGSWIGSSGAAKDWAAMSCGNTDEEAEFNAHLIVALRNNLPLILSSLRRVEPKASMFAVDDQEDGAHSLDDVANLLTDFGAEPAGCGKVYRWAELPPIWITIDTVNDEQVITEYETEEAYRQALTGEA